MLEDIKSNVKTKLQLPRTITVENGGVYQTQQESFRSLFSVTLAAFLLVFMVLLFEFGEFTVPLSIFLVNILALFGVVFALLLTGVRLNISGLVGVIMIIGIIAENAIFVMNEHKPGMAEGHSLEGALVQATRLRVRPILMTTLAAVLALLPFSLGIGAEAEMHQPLAIAVNGGFSLSSLLLTFALPMIYRLLRSESR